MPPFPVVYNYRGALPAGYLYANVAENRIMVDSAIDIRARMTCLCSLVRDVRCAFYSYASASTILVFAARHAG